MGALNGQVITTLTDGTGAPIVVLTWFFDPVTGILRNNPNPWTAPDGTVWPAGSGALIADNQLPRAVRMFVNNDQGVLIRQVKLPASTGQAVTKAVLANQPAPDGPYVNATDFNGFTFDLS